MTILELYLLVNIGLLASYMGFRALRASVGASAPPALAARAGLLLLAAGALAPLALSALPARSLPSLPAVIRQPLAESSRARRARPHRARAATRKFAERATPAWSPPVVRWELLVDCAAWLLLLGIAASLGRTVSSWRRLRQMVREGALIRRVGRVQIRVSAEIGVPLSALSPGSADVLLPEDLVSRPADLAIAIRHELQHHRQGDTLSALALELLGSVFFLNPAMHAWRRELADLQEFACDEAVLGRKKVSAYAYGSCLVRVAEAALGSRVIHAGTACMARPSGNPAHFKSVLRRRIEMVLNRPSGRRRAPVVLAGILSILATLAVALGAQQSLRGSEPETRAANPGRLELDPAIQSIAQRALSRHLSSHKARAGFVLVSEPSTGRLLAVAESGSGAHWALSYKLEPASIIKPIVAAEAVAKKATTLDEKHDCEDGSYQLGSRVYRDWKPFSELSTAEALMQSSNICGIKIGEELGSMGLAQALSDFGIGPGGSAEQFPLARPGEFPAPGELARAEYVPMISTGYSGGGGFYVTPIELVQAYGVFANGGLLLKPYAGPTSVPTVLRRVLTPAVAGDFREVLGRAVLEGTGKNAKSDRYTTAGKTSTAYSPELSDHEKLGGEVSVAGFIGFAPLERPRILVYSVVIDPQDKSPTGNFHAAPMFREVTEAVLKHLGVAPDR
jgi:beta-lactamase regulating signal transducer with metallopeptidase domain